MRRKLIRSWVTGDEAMMQSLYGKFLPPGTRVFVLTLEWWTADLATTRSLGAQ